MIPILGVMFSIYLVFKGVEIWQMGLCRSHQAERAPMLVGVLSLVAGIVLGGFFGLIWLTSGISKTPGMMP
jgi:TRAP-type C4-dicarboxylate transport system permease small subunit